MLADNSLTKLKYSQISSIVPITIVTLNVNVPPKDGHQALGGHIAVQRLGNVPGTGLQGDIQLKKQTIANNQIA